MARALAVRKQEGTMDRARAGAHAAPKEATTMQAGEHFDVDGYDVMASAQTGDGAVQVLNNNSGTFLVAHRLQEGAGLRETAQLLSAITYGEDYQPRYRQALLAMVYETTARLEA
jgi:hypothetical protein